MIYIYTHSQLVLRYLAEDQLVASQSLVMNMLSPVSVDCNSVLGGTKGRDQVMQTNPHLHALGLPYS
jgi:hypothetical protein